MGRSTPLRVATRASALARWQAARIVELLGTDAELVPVTTTGDRSPGPIHAMGGQGVFVKEVQQAVLEGRADVAVHSAKDLPPEAPAGLVLAAIPERADPRDALVGCALHALTEGAVVATGSVRRRAQLAAARPDLRFEELRGNIQTRLDKAGDFSAIVVAAAALDRLDLSDRIEERLDPSVMLPQAGQGAIAVECRADDRDTREYLHAIDDARSHRNVDAERAFLAELGGGCSLPCGALAVGDGDDLELDTMLASLDGRVMLRCSVADHEPGRAGQRAAAELLDRQGGRELLVALAAGGSS